jgi:hypothetical protein
MNPHASHVAYVHHAFGVVVGGLCLGLVALVPSRHHDCQHLNKSLLDRISTPSSSIILWLGVWMNVVIRRRHAATEQRRDRTRPPRVHAHLLPEKTSRRRNPLLLASALHIRGLNKPLQANRRGG